MSVLDTHPMPAGLYILLVVAVVVLAWLVDTAMASRHDNNELGLCEQCHQPTPRARLGLVEVGYAVRSVCPDCARRAR